MTPSVPGARLAGATLAGWDKLVRTADGTTVRPTDTGTWIILPADGGPVRSTCPCCKKPFAQARFAQLVADALYPLSRADDPA